MNECGTKTSNPVELFAWILDLVLTFSQIQSVMLMLYHIVVRVIICTAVVICDINIIYNQRVHQWFIMCLSRKTVGSLRHIALCYSC
jgi:hypothetical protein